MATGTGPTIAPGPLEPASIQGDYERLRRLRLNLVDNGSKYTPPGGRVTLSLHRCGPGRRSRLLIRELVSPYVAQEQVFQRFYRADSARTHGQGGAGLGLCIAQSIAEAHSGHIQIDSTLGYGSTLTVCLPLQ